MRRFVYLLLGITVLAVVVALVIPAT